MTLVAQCCPLRVRAVVEHRVDHLLDLVATGAPPSASDSLRN
jgi:hypothetical protein